MRPTTSRGNLVHNTQRLSREYRQALDWTAIDSALPASNGDDTVDDAALQAAIESVMEAEVFWQHDWSTMRSTARSSSSCLTATSSGAKRNVIQPV